MKMNQYAYLELIDKKRNHEKFYEVKLDSEKNELYIRYGRIGQQGQEQILNDELEILMQIFLQKKNEKIKKGYLLVDAQDQQASGHDEVGLTSLMIKSNLETIIKSLALHIKKEHKVNLGILLDLIESSEFTEDSNDLEEWITSIFAEFLYQTSSDYFAVDWKDVESMKEYLEEIDDKFLVFLPENFVFLWDELPQDETEHSIPLVLNIARNQLIPYGLEMIIFNDDCDVYRGWMTAMKYVNNALIAAENLSLDLAIPDDEWLEMHE